MEQAYWPFTCKTSFQRMWRPCEKRKKNKEIRKKKLYRMDKKINTEAKMVKNIFKSLYLK